MQLTNEQYDIINSTGDIKINAVAGSGKTTTIIEYAKARPATSKILYLAFNKSVKIEAQKKFADKELYNVKIETAHSLAYKHIVRQHGYKVRAQGYKTGEIVEQLNLQNKGEKYAEYIIANHINKFVSYFCNSEKQKVQDLNYMDTISDDKAKSFVSNFYNYIEQQTRIFLDKMENGVIDITHDFYLKKFQLACPTLHYDYILFDEGQDASPAMLDVFFKQKATKVIVGDTHQQIYGWRYAVNSLEKANFRHYNLSTSFRFRQDIANLAMDILAWKKYIGKENNIPIVGKGTTETTKTKAVIARTNLGLLVKAIEYVTEKQNIKNIYFEGNINSYTYADDGASLYDVLSLYSNKRYLIKDKLIRQMRNLEELEDYVEKTEDSQLGMLIDIVKEYGDEIPEIIRKIKEKHVENSEKEKAEMVFSTVHRCKGLEYDVIQIVDDFTREEELANIKIDAKSTLQIDKLNEEINLLYVAVTRTKNSIYVPASLIPNDFPASSNIHIMRRANKEVRTETTPQTGLQTQKSEQNPQDKVKAYTFEEVREKHAEAYRPWTQELDDELTVMYCEGVNVRDLAKHFGRTNGAIRARIKKLELEELYG